MFRHHLMLRDFFVDILLDFVNKTKIASLRQSKRDLISKTFVSFWGCHIVMISFQETPNVICEEFKETVNIGLIVFSSNYRV